jgi:uncharacterized protein (DUF169 family)
MLRENDKKLIEKLNLKYPCIAIRFALERPKCEHYQGDKLAFCQYVKVAQDTKKHFYIESKDDACYGKLSLGMEPIQPVTASGEAGKDFGCFKQQMPNRLLYKDLPMLPPGTIRYVEFAPAVDCDFQPDLLYFVADIEESDIIMRATSYISGDLWESKSSPVMSCTWMYAYPLVSGKVNHITTGLYHGLKRRKAYPAGLRMISIPFNKFPEFFQSLEEMDWTLLAFRDDEESKAKLAACIKHWGEMAAEIGSHVDLH